MEKASPTALARQQLELAKNASSGRSARTVYGGHEHVLRQTVIALATGAALDEEALLLAGCEGTPFAELTAQHARLHALAERLAQANVTHCSLPELRRVVAELVNVLAEHLATEQALLAGLAETSHHPVPSASALASGAQTWLAANDAPLLIVLDHFPRDLAAQLCIERLLRLRPGQTAEIRSSDDNELAHIYRWMRAFDTASYCIDYVSANTPEAHLRVSRRAGPT